MPFKSQAQRKWMFANKPDMAKEFANKTHNMKDLPEHAGDKDEKMTPARRRAMMKVLAKK